MDLATEKLQLTTAARRFYTQDGTQILDTQDLLKWAVQFYKQQIDDSKSSKNAEAEQLKRSKSEILKTITKTDSKSKYLTCWHF